MVEGHGDRGERAKRGSYPDGERNKHAGGHCAVAEGSGGTGPYLMASLNYRGSPDRPTLVWVQGPESWCQWQVRSVGDLNIAVMEIWGRLGTSGGYLGEGGGLERRAGWFVPGGPHSGAFPQSGRRGG